MVGLSPEELKSLIMSVGTRGTKRRYSPIEVGRKFEKAIDKGASLKDCAEAVQLKSGSMISKFLRLLKLSPEIQHLIDWGQSGATIGFTAAWRLTQLAGRDQVAACGAVLEHQFTSREVEQLIQLRVRSGKPIADCIKMALRLRPQVERRHVFVGAITSEKLRSSLSTMIQENRDKLLLHALHKRFPKLRDFACRLGAGRFTVVGRDNVAEVLKGKGEDFENAINATLLESVQL